MKQKIKSALIVKITKKSSTIALSIKNENKVLETHKVKWDKSDDFWDSTVVDGQLFDINIWRNDLTGVLKATLYPTRESGHVIETVTSVFSSKKVFKN